MTHFFDRKDPWGNGMAVWVVMAMVFAFPLAWWSLGQTRLENDVEKWLPNDDPELKVLQWANSQFPVEERVFVSWDSSSLNDPRIRKFVEKLEGKLDADGIRRGGVPHVSHVVEPRDLLFTMQKNGVEPQEAMRRLEGVILGAGTLKLKLTEYGKSGLRQTRQELATAARARFGVELEFSDPVPDFWTLVAVPPPPPGEGEKAMDPAPPATIDAAGKLIADGSVEHDLQVIWKGIRPASEQTQEIAEWMIQFDPEKDDSEPLVERCFFALGSPITIALAISEAGLADKNETVDVIRESAVAVGIPADELRLGGSTVSATELNHEVAKSVWDPAYPLLQFHRRSVVITSALLSSLLAYLLLRSIRLATIVLLVSLYATMAATTLIPLTGGSMNMVLVVMPSLLMVLTLSGAIHVANYWKHAACKNESTAIAETVRTSWMPCALASLTTSIGLVSLCTSSLTPVRDFGMYSAAGALMSLGFILFCMPALLQIWQGKPPQDHELDHPGWRMVGRGLTTWPLLQLFVTITVCVACSYGLTRFRTETKVIRYFPEKARIAQDYWFIETYLAGIMPVETIIRFDVQAQKDTNFLERMEVVRAIQERLRGNSEITGSLSLADFLPVSETLDDDAGMLTRTRYFKRANLIEQRIRDGEVPAAATFYAMADSSHDLLEKGDNRLNKAGDELWRITSQVAIMTDNDFAEVLGDVNRISQDVLKLYPGAEHTITGTVPLFLRTQRAVLQSLISSFGLAFVLILGVFVYMLRSFWAGLVAMIPNIVPITVVFGGISWMGQKVDVGTMITASIALGIAVDGTLHYLTWVQIGMKLGQSRRQAIINALVHSGPAMWQTSLAVALGLLVLIPAELLLISRFGWLMATMIAVALLSDIVLMPQLLASPLGYLFEPAKPKLHEAPPSVPLHENQAAAAVETTDLSVPAPHFGPRSHKPESQRPAS
ncbi:MAG: MMPL family transporter [Planctomycetes bacterium]|nr:MMPL family transporter [Planctomycetota bacterium]